MRCSQSSLLARGCLARGPSTQSGASESEQPVERRREHETDHSAPSSTQAAAPATPPSPPRPLVGPHQLLYSTAPRPLIPLTASPTNHKLWNPPAPDSAQTRSIDKDESGRLARFAGRFGGAAPVSSAAADDAGAADKKDDGLFGIESDMSWLEGVTTQSPGTALGKRDVVGPGKKEKGKGKK